MNNKINCKKTNIYAAAGNLSISAMGKGNSANAIMLIFLFIIILLPGCLSGGGGDAAGPAPAGQKSIIITGNVIQPGSVSASSPAVPETQIGGGAEGAHRYAISITGINGQPLPAASITLVNGAFTASIPLDENINYAVIVVKDGVTDKTLYKNLMGRLPKLSETAAAGGDIAVKNAVIDNFSTARTLLALENMEAVPQVPIALESITLDPADAAKNKTAFEKELESKLGAANISELKKAVDILSSAISDPDVNASLNYSGIDECKTVYINFIDILKSSYEQSPKLTTTAASKIKRIISDAGVDVSTGILVNGETINKDSSAEKINNPPVISGVQALPAAGIITVRYGLSHADADNCAIKIYLMSETSETLIAEDKLSGDIFNVSPGADKTIVINIASYAGLEPAAAYKIKLVPFDNKAAGIFEQSQSFTLTPAVGPKPSITAITLQSSNISGDTEINYNLYELNNRSCDIKVYYSINYAATTEINAADINGDIKNVTPATLKKISWKSKNSLPGEIKNVRLILTAETNGATGDYSVSPAFNIVNPVSFVKTFEYSPKNEVRPEKRNRHAGVIDSADNMWIIGGSNSSYGASDDLWMRAAGSGLWSRITPAISGDKKFYARSSHSAAIDSNNKIWIVGGLVNDATATNEVWCFNTASSTLEYINTTGEIFSASYGHAASMDPAGNLWIIGGGGDGTVSNEVWRLNTNTLQWAKITAGGGEFAPARRYAGAAGRGGKLWIFGGVDGSNQLCDDIWRFDTLNLGWEKITPAGAQYKAGAYQACVMATNDKIYITGGKTFYNDPKGSNKIFSFDTRENSITEIAVQSDIFQSRYSHISVIDSKNIIYIMGGRAGGDYNDTWYSNDFGVTWQNPAADHSKPRPRHHHSSVVTDSGRLFIIGGCDNEGNYLSDVWYSDDAGASWIEASKDTPYDKKISARMSHSSLIYQGKIYVLGGTSRHGVLNCVMRSEDNGASWTDITAATAAGRKFSARAAHTSVVDDNGKMWVIGGYRYLFNTENGNDFSDAWVSEDLGASWTIVNPGIQTILKSPAAVADTGADIIYSAFMPTSGHTGAIDKNGTLYVIGGGSPHTWFSRDGGAKWQKKIVATPEFSMRKHHAGFIDARGRVFVTGGRDTINAAMNDAWYTNDFSNWIMLKSCAFASPRFGHAAATDKNGRVYITGGINYNGETVNDMCYYLQL